jgi:exonuclease SbcD
MVKNTLTAGTPPLCLIHVSDIHLGSGETHGVINPATGLNTRFEDFVKAFSSCVDFAIDRHADIFLFSGDAYRNPSPEPVYQKAFAAQLRRLSQAGIKTILLVGNHDQILKSTASHSMSVFQSLAVPNVTTIDQPQRLVVDTKSGACQIIGLPHVTRHLLMEQEQYANLPAADIEKVMRAHVRDILAQFYEELDPTLPCVVTAHMMVDSARAGTEQDLMVGWSMSFPADIFVDERVDYVALGHVHGHQVLRRSQPSIVYAGSIERVDFSEEKEDKGFVEVQLARQNTEFQFHSINPRPFVTVNLDLSDCSDPQSELLKAISEKTTAGCVLRIKYQIQPQALSLIDEQKLRQAAQAAMSLQLKPEIMHQQRTVRMPELTESCVVAPLTALGSYLDKVQVPAQDKEKLLKRAQDLCQELESQNRE